MPSVASQKIPYVKLKSAPPGTPVARLGVSFLSCSAVFTALRTEHVEGNVSSEAQRRDCAATYIFPTA